MKKNKFLSITMAAVLTLSPVMTATAGTVEEFTSGDGYTYELNNSANDRVNTGDEILEGDFDITYTFHSKLTEGDAYKYEKNFDIAFWNDIGVGSSVNALSISGDMTRCNFDGDWAGDEGENSSSIQKGTFTKTRDEEIKGADYEKLLGDADVTVHAVKVGDTIAVTNQITTDAGQTYTWSGTATADFGQLLYVNLDGNCINMTKIHFTVNSGNSIDGKEVIRNDATGIPDEELYRILLNQGDGDGKYGNKDGILTREEALHVKEIIMDHYYTQKMHPKSYENLAKFCPNIEYIDFYKEWTPSTDDTVDSTTAIDGLMEEMSDFYDLKKLCIYGPGVEVTTNQLRSLGSDKLSELTYLDIWVSDAFDYSILEPAVNLENVRISIYAANPVEVKTSEVFQTGMTKLNMANLHNYTSNGTIHVDSISDDEEINQIYLSTENLDLAGFKTTGISTLELYANHWENVPSFETLALSLTKLYLGGRIDEVAQYSQLFDFKVDYTKFQNLTYLKVTNQDLSAIDFSKLSRKLNELYITKCKVPDTMDFSNHTDLQDIYIIETNVKDISGLSEIEYLGSVKFNRNELTKLPELPLENMYSVTAYGNKISSIPDLSKATMSILELSGNDLTVEALKGRVPESFENDNSWMVDSTRKDTYDEYNFCTKIYTELNSPYIMNQFKSEKNSLISYNVYQPQIVIEDELVQYMKKNEKNLIIVYMDPDTKREIETAYVSGSKIPEDYTGSITIDFSNIPENGMWEVNDALVKDTASYDSYLTYSMHDTSSYVDIYTYSDTAGYMLKAKRVAFSQVSTDYKNGVYKDQKIYVRNAYMDATDENRTHTNVQGQYSDAEYVDSKDALSLSYDNEESQNVLKKMVENAEPKSLLEIKCSDNMYIPAQVWNQIVDKELDLQISFVTVYNDLTTVLNIKNEDMVKLTDLNQWISINNSYCMYEDAVTAGFYAAMYVIDSDAESEDMPLTYQGDARDYIKEVTAKYHMGYRIANGREVATQKSDYYYLNKNYKGESVAYRNGQAYEVESGYITVGISAESGMISNSEAYFDVTDLPTKDELKVDEAPLPNTNVGAAAQGDILAESSENGEIKNIVLAGATEGYTIYADFTCGNAEDESNATVVDMTSRSEHWMGTDDEICVVARGNDLKYTSTVTGYIAIRDCLNANEENVVYITAENISASELMITFYVNEKKIYQVQYDDTGKCTEVYNYGYETLGISDNGSSYTYSEFEKQLKNIDTIAVNKTNIYMDSAEDSIIDVKNVKVFAGTMIPDDVSDNDEHNFICTEYGKVGSTPFAVNGNFELEYAFDLQAYLHNERNNNFGIQITDGTETVDAVCDSSHCTDTEMSALKSAHVIVNVKREGNTITVVGKVGKKTVFTYTKENVKLNAASTVRITGEYCKVKNLVMEDLTKTLVSGSVGDTTVNEKPAVVEETKIVDNTKVESTVVNNMENTIKKNIEVVTNNSTALTPEIVTAMKEKDKNVTIGVVDETNKLQYSWTFKGDDIDTVSKPIDLSLKFATEKQQEVEAITGQKNTVYLSFGYHGELPGEATMRTYVGDKYKNGERIYLYYYNEETGKVEAAGGKALEVKEGYVEFSITHCSVYFLTDDIFNSIELALSSNYTLNTLKKLIKGVQTGTTVTELETNFENSALKVLDLEGNEVKTVSKVGTGFRIQQITNGNVVDEIAVVITGDVSGDGIVNVMDMEAIQKNILSIAEINTEAAMEAANVNDDKVINVMDMEAIQKHILGLEILE